MESLTKRQYLLPFCFIVEDVWITNGKIVVRIKNTSKAVVFGHTKKVENIAEYNSAMHAIKTVDEKLAHMYKAYNDEEIEKVENKFLLEYLHHSIE